MQFIRANKIPIYMICIIISLNFIFDLITGVLFTKESNISIVRALIIYFIIFYIYIKHIYLFKYNYFLIIFLLHTLFLLPISNNIEYAVQSAAKIFASILLYPISLYYIKTKSDFEILSRTILFGLFLLFINFIISITFKIGIDIYNQEGTFLVGNMYDNWNVYTYSLFFSPLILYFTNLKRTYTLSIKKLVIIFILIFNLLVLFLSMKRTAMIGLLLGFTIFISYYKHKARLIQWLLFLFLFLLVLWPYYSEYLINRFNVRQDRFEVEAVERDARYTETFIVIDEVFDSNNLLKMFIGDQVFNSPGNYANGSFDDRPLHVDYNLIIHGHGILGFLIYIFIFIKIYFDFTKLSKNLANNEFSSLLKPLFYTLLIVQFFTSFGGQITGITFRSLVFVGLGACVGYAKSEYLNSQLIK